MRFLLLVTLLGLTAGCLPALPEIPVEDFTIEIVAPSGDPLDTSSTIVSVAVGEAFQLDAEGLAASLGNTEVFPEGINWPGRGHWELLVDGNIHGHSAGDSLPVTRLDPGVHTISVELVQNDHRSLDPVKTDEVEIEVNAGAPQVMIASPYAHPGGGISLATDARISLEVAAANFSLDDGSIGGNPDPCECTGHWIASLGDGETATDVITSGKTNEWFDVSSVMGGLAEGTYTLEIRLVNHDGSDLPEPVFDRIQLEVGL